jgi:hypothetical protein
MTVQRTPEDLEEQLREQIRFLERSCSIYDDADVAAAKEIATRLRLLLHDPRPASTSKSRSLLGQLNAKNDRPFWNSAVPNHPANLLTHCGLVCMSFNTVTQRVSCVPHLDDPPSPPRSSSFAAWWEEEIFHGKDGVTFTRNLLVRSVADQDGGAHVDPDFSDDYAALARGNAYGWTAVNADGSGPVRPPELPAIRQIGHELLKSLLPSYGCSYKSPQGQAEVIFFPGEVRQFETVEGADAYVRGDQT